MASLAGLNGTQCLPRAIPQAIAMKMLLTGEMIDAQEALRVVLFAVATYKLKKMPAVLTIRRKYFESIDLQGFTESTLLDPGGKKVELIAEREEKSEGIPLEDAEVIVSGGRGIGSAENFSMLQNMADFFNGAVGASRGAVTKFCSDIISLVFLLNYHYTPYFKWKHRAVRALANLKEFFYSKIAYIVANWDPKAKNAILNEISSEVINMFHKEGLSNIDSNFLLDNGPVISQKIKDYDLRTRNVGQDNFVKMIISLPGTFRQYIFKGARICV